MTLLLLPVTLLLLPVTLLLFVITAYATTTITASDTAIVVGTFFPTSETTIVDGALQVYDAKVKRCLKPQTLQYHSAPMQTS